MLRRFLIFPIIFMASEVAAAPLSPWPDQACPESRPSESVRTARIDLLKSAIRAAVLTPSPHAAAAIGSGTVFTGNYDWHSAVHAHWALLSIARVAHDADLEKFVMSRLTPENLSRERVWLADPTQAGFEMPYGQSWLLVLFDELSRHPNGKTKELVEFRHEVEERVMHWLETNPFPEKDGEFIAAHHSWLYSLLMFQMSNPSNVEIVGRLKAVRKRKLQPVRARIGIHISVDSDFLYLPAVLAMVDLLSQPTAYPMESPAALQYPILQQNAHTAGRAMVRNWPYAVLARSGNPAACARFHTRMNEMFARTDHWKDDFHNVSHWVPQFMWMGMWLEMGRP